MIPKNHRPKAAGRKLCAHLHSLLVTNEFIPFCIFKGKSHLLQRGHDVVRLHLVYSLGDEVEVQNLTQYLLKTGLEKTHLDVSFSTFPLILYYLAP